MTTHPAALPLPTPTAPFASLLPVLTLEQASDKAAALALNMHIPTHVTRQRGLYRVWDDGDIAAGYADKDDIVTTVDPEDVYPIVCEEELEMANDEAAWELQHLKDCKAQLDQGRETLALAGVLYFDSDGISHGIDQLIERYAKLRAAAELAFTVLEEEMGPMEYDDGPPASVCDAYNALFKALNKAPAPETNDDGADLPL